MKGELFDHALLVGMSSDEYWFGDPALLYNYNNAFELKQKYDVQMAWVQGSFFRSALGSTQVWTTSPLKSQDWNKMPKYVDNPIKEDLPKRVITPEHQKFIDETREKLAAMGLLRRN